MFALQQLLSPTPASPGRRKAGAIDMRALSSAEHEAVLDALEWSDLDSSEALVKRTDSALAQLESVNGKVARS